MEEAREHKLGFGIRLSVWETTLRGIENVPS